MSNPIKEAIDRARASQPEQYESTLKLSLELLNAANVEPTPIKWLWPGFLAAGKLHILGGAPGVGKSTVALRLATSVTTGCDWPGGHISEPGSVVI